MSAPDFLEALTAEMVQAAYDYVAETDDLRFPEQVASRRDVARHKMLALAANAGFARRETAYTPAMAELFRDLNVYSRSWPLLGDDHSRWVYAKLLALRALGPRHVRLPIDSVGYWRSFNAVKTLRGAGPALDGGLGLRTRIYSREALGVPLRVRCDRLSVLHVFHLRQYELHRAATVMAEPGDVVIDGGAAWGDTALLFAHQAGPDGQVVALDFVESSLRIFGENMRLNPTMAERIHLEPLALWNKSGVKVHFTVAGPGTRVAGPGECTVGTVSIDDLVERRRLQRVNFIKLDIEGAEHEALKGARETLRRFKPKLAISAYHRPHDLAELPSYIHGLGLGYTCYLDHFTSHTEETVLFALAE